MEYNDTQYGTENGNFEVSEYLQQQKEVEPPQKSRKTKYEKPLWREYVETIAVALLAALILRVFVVSAYHVSSGSMEDTLTEGDYIFVNKLAYDWGEPTIGDVIVFDNPFEESKDYIKRIMAVEGQTVEIVDKVLYIDGEVAPIPYYSKHIDNRIFPSVLSNRDNFGPMLVPSGQYFVLGDNRDDSQDSRSWGCVDKKHIKGRAIFVYFSYEPDADAPEWKAPYVLEFFQISWHNLTTFPSRFRITRLGPVQ